MSTSNPSTSKCKAPENHPLGCGCILFIEDLKPGESVEIAIPLRSGDSVPYPYGTDGSAPEEDIVPEQWHYSDRRIPFPWGLAVFFLLLGALVAFSIVWVLRELGWS